MILEFWRALATFSPQEQANFLRFVTSCPRPPLLGFRCVNRGPWGGTGHALLHDNRHGACCWCDMRQHCSVLQSPRRRYLEPPLAIQASVGQSGAL